MIAFYACAGTALLLFVLLFFLGTGTGQDDRGLDDSAELQVAQCPAEVVEQVFSSQDFAYISRMGSSRLRRFYISERRRIAMGWIRRTSADLSRAIQFHVRAAREAQDLEAATEAKVLLQYVQLRCLCGLLLLSVVLVRPSLLQEIAVYASGLSHRLEFAGTGAKAVRQITPTRARSSY